jgi:hypothetical protein
MRTSSIKFVVDYWKTAIFLKVHGHYRYEIVFFWGFSGPRGGAHYATLNTVFGLHWYCGVLHAQF